MLLTEFLDRLGKLDALNYVGLDDSADRLNCLYTVLLLVVFSGVTTVKTYFLTPIACYLPNSVGSHEGQAIYVTNMCYTDGLYNVPAKLFKVDNTRADWDKDYRATKIYYYQWVPFLFAVQGVAFYAPSLFWRLCGQAGDACDLWQLVRAAAEPLRSPDGDRKDKAVRQVTRQLELWLRANRGSQAAGQGPCLGQGLRRLRRGSSLALCLPSKRLGTRLVWMYMLTKLMYIGNLTCQLLMMAALLRTDPSVPLLKAASGFSVELAKQLVTGSDWRRTGLFPRSGSCAVALITATDVQVSVAQCALPVNMIHEKLFAFLWIWMAALLAATLVSFTLWCGRLALPQNRRRHLARSLRLAGAPLESAEDRALFAGAFADDFVGHDGDLLLRLLGRAWGEASAAEVCAGLFRGFADACRKETIATSEDHVVEITAVGVAGNTRKRNCSGGAANGQQHHQQQQHHYPCYHRSHHQQPGSVNNDDHHQHQQLPKQQQPSNLPLPMPEIPPKPKKDSSYL